MKSKKQLFTDLALIGCSPEFRFLADVDEPTQRLRHKHIGNETYGRKSVIYIWAMSPQKRRALELKLETLGHKVNREYWPTSGNLAVQVSYFKGWHWNE